MDTLLFVIFTGLALYGFFLTTLGQDLLKTALEALNRDDRAASRRGGKGRCADRQRFGGRDTFGQRGR